jgi:hypothetical protein
MFFLINAENTVAQFGSCGSQVKQKQTILVMLDVYNFILRPLYLLIFYFASAHSKIQLSLPLLKLIHSVVCVPSKLFN